MSNKWYGYHPDVPDKRDFTFTPPDGVTILPSVDLRSKFPLPPFDQGNLGSCTANGVAGAITFDQAKQSLQIVMPSRLFQYYNSRVLEDTVKSDSGATIRDSVKAYNTYGYCSEKDKPYHIGQFTRKPSKTAYAHAIKHQPVKYSRVDQSRDQIQLAVSAGFPVIIGFSVYESFESQQVADSGRVPMPSPSEQLLGGHCVLICGYDGSNYISRNSWNTDWGDQGYFYMPYAYAEDPNLAEDFWCVEIIN